MAGFGGRAAASEEVAVNARVFNGYARVKLADGTFKPESYAFGEGGRWNSGPADKSIDAIPFRTIAETIAGPLRAHAYLPATDPKETDLMILVFWGTTASPADGLGEARPLADVSSDETLLGLNAGENQLRDQGNATNARILGYGDDYVRELQVRDIGHVPVRDVVSEIEEGRYFVVLKAYDFRSAWKEKKLKLLWEARFSIPAQGNRFDQQLHEMAQTAARNFGQDTKGLVHQEPPEGRVEIGKPTVVEPKAGAPAK
jgi:hypothetical protein